MAIKVSMISLGCSKNQVDAEHLLAALAQNGFTLCGDVSESDVVIINTCGFIQSAKEEAIENILEMAALKKEGTIKGIVVTGCLAERYRDEIVKEMDEVDVVLGIGSNDKICEAVEKAAAGSRMTAYGEKESLCLSGERVLTTLPFYAYLKIAEGCDNCCTYCAIPQIRGRFRSRPMEELVKEAEWLASQGVKELVVVAQDTTRYGEDLYGEYKLAELLKKLCKIDGLRWIRTLYCYPDKITEELIDVIAAEEKLVKYLDIPIQHCEEAVLRSMNRSMDRASLTALMKKLRSRIPGLTLRTTVMVGFPGETEEQFAALSEFIEEVRFDRLGCFAFSAEEGTAAADMDGQIDEDVKKRREEVIMTQQSIIMEQLNREKIGERLLCVVEGFDRYGECYFGRTEADAPDVDGKVFFTSEDSLKMGDFVKVRVNEVMDYDLVGECVSYHR
ncbi:MAG: 30S ribosomal protein S12 methylthiotransferase RimO [Oscillospiraceae bacterium]|nr:30S ribosomal protein S12 methylthiotransferase RimO [Oscillospiraceae bacterium]MDY3065681.1 30S ribosomal protein S12 methylthiotransferase RimO [Oscillospiraceae bacterium]